MSSRNIAQALYLYLLPFLGSLKEFFEGRQ
jgi:hypothetical protein